MGAVTLIVVRRALAACPADACLESRQGSRRRGDLARHRDRLDPCSERGPQCFVERSLAAVRDLRPACSSELHDRADELPLAIVERDGRGVGDPRTLAQVALDFGERHSLVLDLREVIAAPEQLEPPASSKRTRSPICSHAGCPENGERTSSSSSFAIRTSTLGIAWNAPELPATWRRHATPLVSVLPSTSTGHVPSTRPASAAASAGNRPPEENTARQRPAPAGDGRSSSTARGSRRAPGRRRPRSRGAPGTRGGTWRTADVDQRPKHAEQHAVDVPRRHGRVHACVADLRAPQELEDRELGFDVVQAAGHLFWYACRARRVEHELGRRRDRVDSRRVGASRSQTSRSAPASAPRRIRSRRRWSPRAHRSRGTASPRAPVFCLPPSSLQRRRELKRVVELHRPALAASLRDGGRDSRGRADEVLPAVHGTAATEARDMVGVSGQRGRDGARPSFA